MLALAGLLPLVFLVIWLFTVRMPGPAFSGPLPPLTPDQQRLRSALERHVRELAQHIGVRSDRTYSNVQRAATYIETTLTQLGYQVSSQEYSARGLIWRNLEATLRGGGRPQQVVIVGAHYDSAEEAPGADDNASGVAGVLELARRFAAKPQLGLGRPRAETQLFGHRKRSASSLSSPIPTTGGSFEHCDL